MKRVNLFDLIAILPKTDLKTIYQANPTGLLKLYIRYHKNIQEKTDAFFVEALFGADTPSNSNKYRGRKKTVKGHIEEYLIAQELKKQPLKQQELLLERLAKLENSEYYFAYVKEYTKKLESKKDKGLEDYYFLSKIYSNIHFHPNNKRFSKDDYYLQQAVKYRKKASLLQALQDTCELMNRAIFLKQIDNIHLEQVHRLIEKTTKHQEFVFKIYNLLIHFQIHAFKLSTETSKPLEKNFLLDFEDLLHDNFSNLSDLDIKRLGSCFMNIINFARERVDYNFLDSKEDQKYIQKIFKIYQLFDKKNLFLFSRKIAYDIFISVAAVSSSVGAFFWYKTFRNKYYNMLCSNKEETIALSDAYCAFYEQKFALAMKILSTLSSNNSFFKIHCRFLKLSCQYELFVINQCSYDELFKEIEKHRHFFYRESTINESKKLIFRNTLRLVSKLANANNNPNFKRNDKILLKKEILETKPILSKTWLLMKVEDI